MIQEVLQKGSELANISQKIEDARKKGDLDTVQELTPLFEEGQNEFQQLAQACGWRKSVTNQEDQ